MTDLNLPGVHTTLGAIKPDTRAVIYEVVAAARKAGHPVFFVWGWGKTGDHRAGYAADFMVYANGTIERPGPIRKEVGTWISEYIWRHRKRLGVRYVIFGRRIRSETGFPRNIWRPYLGRSHANHVHMSRYRSGAPAYKSLPVVTPLPKLRLSDFNAARSDIPRGRAITAHPLTVHRAEWALHDFGLNPGPIDGHYGIRTDIAVRAFQRLVSPGVDPDGILGPREWERLAGGPKDGKHPGRFIPIGTLTLPELTPYWLSYLLEARQKDLHAARFVVTHAATTNAVEKALRAWGYDGHLVIDGHYGTSTEVAVRWFQAKVSPGTRPDGALSPQEWARLAAGPGTDGKDLFVPKLGNYQRWI